MIKNHLLFPIYEFKEQQFRYRNNYKNDLLHSFKVPAFTLPAFFFSRSKNPYNISSMQVFNINNEVTPAATINTNFLHLVSAPTYDAFGYTSRVIKRQEDLLDSSYANYQLPCGYYYIKLTEATSGKTYYSEVFEAVDAEGIADGIELVQNGNFDNLFVTWSLNGSWSFPGGVATFSGGNNLPLLQYINTGNDAAHFYKVSFTISNYNNGGDPSRYLRAYTRPLDFGNNVKVTGNGAYTWYVDDVECFLLSVIGGTVTFAIDNISIQRVVGFTNYVSLLLVKQCKYPNHINPDNFFYTNLLLLDAEIYKPEYGEENVQQENGLLQKITTFTRAFKRHVLSPLLLPEPVADALAQLNTFDTVEIYNAHAKNYFVYKDEEHELERQVTNFDVKIQWQDPDVYALVDISFDENLEVKDRCCDDSSDITPCFNALQTIGIQLTQDVEAGTITISSNSNPTGLDAAIVEISVGKVEVSTYTTCDSALMPAYAPVISMPWQQFKDEGILYTANDQLDYVYKFRVTFRQLGCDVPITSTACTTKPTMLISTEEQNCIEGTGLVLTLNISLTLYSEVILEYWNGTTWIALDNVSNGANFIDLNPIPAGWAGKFRLRYNNATSAEYLTEFIVCP